MDPETIIYLLWLAASFLVIWWGHANGRLKPGMHSTGLLAIRRTPKESLAQKTEKKQAAARYSRKRPARPMGGKTRAGA